MNSPDGWIPHEYKKGIVRVNKQAGVIVKVFTWREFLKLDEGDGLSTTEEDVHQRGELVKPGHCASLG